MEALCTDGYGCTAIGSYRDLLTALEVYIYTIVCSRSVFESGSLHNGGMLILRIYFAVDGMPIEMYGESWIAGLLTSDDIMLYMAGFGTT